MFFSGSIRQDRRQLPRGSQRHHRAGRRHRGRGVHQEVHHSQGCSRQVAQLVGKMHRGMEMSDWTMGEKYF